MKPEPSDAPASRPSGPPRFVVHEHHARRLHWDLRLEHGGVLVSFAVPKGVPLRPGERRLAIRTEDHDLAYIGFEGVIPEGEYGAGTVTIWDRGRYETLEGGPGTRWVVRFEGGRLRGTWALIPFPKGGEGAHLLLRTSKPPTHHEDVVA